MLWPLMVVLTSGVFADASPLDPRTGLCGGSD